MVSSSRVEDGAQVLLAGFRRNIQSIKEIVGNYSDADIYVALKETSMDPKFLTKPLKDRLIKISSVSVVGHYIKDCILGCKIYYGKMQPSQ